jgi:hypothetical protein
MLRGETDLYTNSLLPAAFDTFSRVQTPWATHPPLDDTFVRAGIPGETYDVAPERCGIHIPGVPTPPSEFAIYNSDLSKRRRRSSSAKALNHYFEGRHLACAGFGSGKSSTQVYLLGEDGRRGHRHAAPLNLQLYTHGWEVFPDLGYICDHPGNQWVKATPSHQTVTIDGRNGYWAEQSELLAFETGGQYRFIDKRVVLQDGSHLRRAITLIRKPDGWPVLIDLFEVRGGKTQDYAIRVDAPRDAFRIDAPTNPRGTKLYQEHSFYPLESFRTAGKIDAPLRATWGNKDRRVQATILTRCSELITYQSPGWRTQHEITSLPDKYFNTLVLRNRKASSRFLVVYETGPKSVIHPVVEDVDDQYWRIRLAHRGGLDWQVRIPVGWSDADRQYRISRI